MACPMTCSKRTVSKVLGGNACNVCISFKLYLNLLANTRYEVDSCPYCFFVKRICRRCICVRPGQCLNAKSAVTACLYCPVFGLRRRWQQCEANKIGGNRIGGR